MRVAHVTNDGASAATFRVRRVQLPGGRSSWTIVGPDGGVVVPVDGFLAFLTNLELSPNTVHAYAYDLAYYFGFLNRAGQAWDGVTVETFADFVGALRQPGPNVVLLDGAQPARATSTVYRKLAAMFSFYDYHERNGVTVGATTMARGRSGRGSYSCTASRGACRAGGWCAWPRRRAGCRRR
jgi:integrase/recombinase XerD